MNHYRSVQASRQLLQGETAFGKLTSICNERHLERNFSCLHAPTMLQLYASDSLNFDVKISYSYLKFVLTSDKIDRHLEGAFGLQGDLDIGLIIASTA